MNTSAFSLIELLIVISIIAVISAMAMPVLGIAQRAAKQTNTQSILRTVENGLGQFKMDVGIHPWHDHAVVGDLEPNRLAETLAYAPSDAERAAYRADLAADLAVLATTNAATRQTFDNNWVVNGKAIGTGDADISVYHVQSGTINRLKNERARLAFLAGNTGITGAKDPTQKLVSNPRSAGYRDDYIRGDLTERYLDGRSVLDAYGSPLLYVCRALPTNRPIFLGDSVALGPRAVFNNFWGTIHGVNYGMPALTRIPTTLLNSDVRTHAAAAFIDNYELWSPGRDRLAAPIRNDAVNRDDILAGPYRNALR